MSDQNLSPGELRRIVDEVSSHEKRDGIALLAFDWMTRQGEGRTLLVGRDWVQKRAGERHVTREMTATSAGALLDILERGVENAREAQMIAAFAVAGWGLTLRDADDSTRGIAVERFLRHADWFEMSTTFSLYSFVDVLLSADDARAIWAKLASQAIRVDHETPKDRAAQVMRLYVLLKSGVAREDEHIERIAREAPEPTTRELASAVLGRRASWGHEALSLSGRTRRVPRRLWIEILRWASSWAFFAALLRVLLFFTGFRSTVELVLRARVLHVTRRVVWLGRVVRESKEQYDASRVVGAKRAARYAWWPSLVGATALAAGIIAGGLWGFDGIRTGTPSLLILGAIVVFVGAAFDFVMAFLMEGMRGRVSLEVVLTSDKSAAISGIEISDADNFIDSLASRIAP